MYKNSEGRGRGSGESQGLNFCPHALIDFFADDNNKLVQLPIGLVWLLEFRRNRRALWQFGLMISCGSTQNRTALHYYDYGCWCGVFGNGNPLDETDR